MFLLRLRWRLIADPYEEVGWPFPDWGGPDSLDGEAFPDELLRFGIQFADGGRVIILDRYPFVSEDLPPDQPVLVEGGGEGSEDGPPPGPARILGLGVGRPAPAAARPLAFVCACRDAESRARGSRLTARIREAADAAVMLWRHDPYVPTTDAMRQSEGPIQDRTRSGLGIAWSGSSRS